MHTATSVDTKEDWGAALLTPEGIRDAYSVYATLRETDPVHWSRRLNAWLVTDYESVREVYRDHTRFSSLRKDVENFVSLPEDVQAACPHVHYAEMTEALSTADPPLHTRHRSPFNRALAPRAMARHHDALEAWCVEQADYLGAQTEPDLIRDFTTPLAYHAVLGVFGISFEYAPIFERAWIARKELTRTGTDRAEEAALAYEATLRVFRDVLEGVYAEHADEDPDSSFIASLLHPANDELALTDVEMFFLMTRFFVAAHENLVYTIAQTVRALLEHPEQLAMVKQDPALVDQAYEEAVRWMVPTHMQKRVAATDFEFDGKTILAGQRVFGYKASANRDEDVWDEPERYDITRDVKGSTMSWGLGVHYCVGAGMARYLGPTAVRTLLDRYPELRLPDGWTPKWRERPMSSYLEELPLLLR